MAALGNAPGDLHVDHLVFMLGSVDQILDTRLPACLVIRIGDRDRSEVAFQPGQMLVDAERHPTINRYDFVDAVAKDEAAIQHRNPGLRKRHRLGCAIDAEVNKRVVRKKIVHEFAQSGKMLVGNVGR